MTRGQNAESIRQSGFHGKTRVETSGGTDYGGSIFGAGTYFHANKAESDKWLKGARAYEWGDEVQIAAQGKLKNPLVVRLPGNGPERDMSVYVQHMRKIGAIRPGETFSSGGVGRPRTDLSPQELSKRLQAMGYDGVDIRTDKPDALGEGSQVLVFNPQNVRSKPTKKVSRLVFKKPGESGPQATIRQVYDGLATNPREGVSLADLRASLRAQNLSDSEVNAALKDLSRQGKVVLAPISARATLKQRDHAAALRIGGEDNHWVTFQ